MRTMQDLREEGDAIRTALLLLNGFAVKAGTGVPVDGEDAEDLIDYFKTVADGCHNCKEEHLVFPALESAGVSREHGPIRELCADHIRERELIRSMESMLPQVSHNDPQALSAFSRDAAALVRLLNESLDRENAVLFNMAEECLSLEEQKWLQGCLDRVMGIAVHSRYDLILDRLRRKYL